MYFIVQKKQTFTEVHLRHDKGREEKMGRILLTNETVEKEEKMGFWTASNLCQTTSKAKKYCWKKMLKWPFWGTRLLMTKSVVEMYGRRKSGPKIAG